MPCDVPSAVRPAGSIEVFSDDLGDRDDQGDRDDRVDLEARARRGIRWRRVAGRRPIVVTPSGAVVGPLAPEPPGKIARLMRPSGQRTAYVVDWPGGAGDVSVEITPPGDARGQGERGRGGLILYEDDRNFLIVNDWLDDDYPGASVSVFRRAGGFEEVYDAVWVNVGERVTWGRPHRLAVSFDPTGFTAHLDGAPVLTRAYRDVYPSYPPLHVRAVGICANWEFGDDTGSRFGGFVARRVPRP